MWMILSTDLCCGYSNTAKTNKKNASCECHHFFLISWKHWVYNAVLFTKTGGARNCESAVNGSDGCALVSNKFTINQFNSSNIGKLDSTVARRNITMYHWNWDVCKLSKYWKTVSIFPVIICTMDIHNNAILNHDLWNGCNITIQWVVTVNKNTCCTSIYIMLLVIHITWETFAFGWNDSTGTVAASLLPMRLSCSSLVHF